MKNKTFTLWLFVKSIMYWIFLMIERTALIPFSNVRPSTMKAVLTNPFEAERLWKRIYILVALLSFVSFLSWIIFVYSTYSEIIYNCIKSGFNRIFN